MHHTGTKTWQIIAGPISCDSQQWMHQPVPCLHHFQPSSTELFPSSIVLKFNPFNSINFTSSIRLNTIMTDARPDLRLPETSLTLTLFRSHLWIIPAGLLCQTPLRCNPPTPTSTTPPLHNSSSPSVAALLCLPPLFSASQGWHHGPKGARRC